VSDAGGAASGAGGHVSPAWARWRATVDLTEYEARFVRLEAAGAEGAHGEADLVEHLCRDRRRAAVLDAGCGTGRLAIELARRGFDAEGVDLDPDLLALARAKAPDLAWHERDLASMRLGRSYDVVVMAGNVLPFCRPDDRGAVVATCAGHLRPGGLLVAGFSLHGVGEPVALDDYDARCAEAGLRLVSRWATWQRAPYAGGGYAVSVHDRAG